MAKMALNGTKFDKETQQRFEYKVKEIINSGSKLSDPEEITTTKEKPNIQERIKEKGQNVIADLEEAYDLFVTKSQKFALYDFLQKNNVSPQISGMIRDYYSRVLEDLNCTDKEVRNSFGKDRLKQARFLEEWMADLDRHTSNRKASKVRKPRKKKQKLAVDVVKRIKYQKEFKPFKIVSIQPTEIVGSQQLWVYNTKYKQMVMFNASGPAGLSMKGTTITGFCKEESQQKTLRKPEEQINKVLSGGKIILRKFMSEIKTKSRVPNGRINENCILLRVVK
jgi:oligoribonuclease NrnB/cAMP/cGMP phosphodiesterase (DHH superfamily)